MFLMKKKPAIIIYIETWWRISNIETRRTFFGLRGCLLLYGLEIIFVENNGQAMRDLQFKIGSFLAELA